MGYHLINIILHITNALLCFFLMMRFTQRRGLAWCVAAVFLVHPVQSEAVACIAGISNLLFTFFLLLSFLFYLKTADRIEEAGLFNEAIDYTGALVFFGCALLCKEQAIVLPVLILLYEFSFTQSLRKRNARWRLRLAGFAIVVGGYLLWRKIIIGSALTSLMSNWGEFILRLKAFPGVIINYLQTIFLPVDLHYYRSYDILSPWVLLALSFMFLVIAIILFVRFLPHKNQALFCFGVGWFFITILPMTSLVPLIHEYSYIAAFEHFLYLPLIGFLLSLFIALDYFADLILRRHSKNIKKIIFACVLAFSVILTFFQNQVWASEIVLFQRAVYYQSGIGRLRLLLAKAYFNIRDFSKAQEQYMIARDIMAGYLGKIRDQRVKPFYQGFLRDSLLGLASCSEAEGKYQQAIEYYEKVLFLTPNDPAVLNNIGVNAIHLGQMPEAMINFKKALEIDPNFAPARLNYQHLLQKS